MLVREERAVSITSETITPMRIPAMIPKTRILSSRAREARAVDHVL